MCCVALERVEASWERVEGMRRREGRTHHWTNEDGGWRTSGKQAPHDACCVRYRGVLPNARHSAASDVVVPLARLSFDAQLHRPFERRTPARPRLEAHRGTPACGRRTAGHVILAAGRRGNPHKPRGEALRASEAQTRKEALREGGGSEWVGGMEAGMHSRIGNASLPRTRTDHAQRVTAGQVEWTYRRCA